MGYRLRYGGVAEWLDDFLTHDKNDKKTLKNENK